MKYFNKNYFIDRNGSTLEHRAKYGTADSVSNEKGTDNKKNNSSEYNHEYYMKNKEKWADNESSSNGDKNPSEDKEFDVDAAAMDVIRGKYGVGEERKRLLGDDYAAVQKRVNEIMKGSAGKSAKESSESSDSNKSKSTTRSFSEAKQEYFKEKKVGTGKTASKKSKGVSSGKTAVKSSKKSTK